MMVAYKIDLTCGHTNTKEDLPHITLQQWKEVLEMDPAEVGQVRVPVELPLVLDLDITDTESVEVRNHGIYFVA